MTNKHEAEQLVRDNIGWMISLAERIVRDSDLAQDVVQDAFINALGALDKFEGRSSLKTWLHRITVNAALGRLRQLKRLAEHSLEEYEPVFDLNDCRVETPWTKLATIEEIIDNDSTRKLVHQKIGEIDDLHRIILQLRDIEGYDTEEVAQVIGISQSNVRIRLHRARRALKVLLEPVLRGEVTQ